MAESSLVRTPGTCCLIGELNKKKKREKKGEEERRMRKKEGPVERGSSGCMCQGNACWSLNLIRADEAKGGQGGMLVALCRFVIGCDYSFSRRHRALDASRVYRANPRIIPRSNPRVIHRVTHRVPGSLPAVLPPERIL